VAPERVKREKFISDTFPNEVFDKFC